MLHHPARSRERGPLLGAPRAHPQADRSRLPPGGTRDDAGLCSGPSAEHRITAHETDLRERVRITRKADGKLMYVFGEFMGVLARKTCVYIYIYICIYIYIYIYTYICTLYIVCIIVLRCWRCPSPGVSRHRMLFMLISVCWFTRYRYTTLLADHSCRSLFLADSFSFLLFFGEAAKAL